MWSVGVHWPQLPAGHLGQDHPLLQLPPASAAVIGTSPPRPSQPLGVTCPHCPPQDQPPGHPAVCLSQPPLLPGSIPGVLCSPALGLLRNEVSRLGHTSHALQGNGNPLSRPRASFPAQRTLSLASGHHHPCRPHSPSLVTRALPWTRTRLSLLEDPPGEGKVLDIQVQPHQLLPAS